VLPSVAGAPQRRSTRHRPACARIYASADHSAARSAIIIVGAFVLPPGIVCMTRCVHDAAVP